MNSDWEAKQKILKSILTANRSGLSIREHNLEPKQIGMSNMAHADILRNLRALVGENSVEYTALGGYFITGRGTNELDTTYNKKYQEESKKEKNDELRRKKIESYAPIIISIGALTVSIFSLVLGLK